MKPALSTFAACLALLCTPAKADNLQNAVDDICKCGFPPSNACIAKLSVKYQRINASPTLQDEVMRRAQEQCGPSQSSIAAMVGNENLQLDKLPAGVASALAGINSVVTETTDCSTAEFSVVIPPEWQCRKLKDDPKDVTLYANQNTLNVSVGLNQGRTSCDLIPVCTSEPVNLSEQFDTTLFTNPIVKSFEFAGAHRTEPTIKLTITAITEPSDADMQDIITILDSVAMP
ncbi:MAG: hypothetical protein AAF499_19310 [Pseudomonadota bacterium]